LVFNRTPSGLSVAKIIRHEDGDRVPLLREHADAQCCRICSRRPAGDAGCDQTTSALRFPQGSGYKIRVGEYPEIPPRLGLIFLNNPVFFITFCTHQRRKLLASDAMHKAFITFATKACSDHNIAVGRYVIMPDHFHLFVRGPDDFQLGLWVGMLKQALAKHVTLTTTSPIWQRGFFDHLLRSDENYSQKWNYVWENPVRAGLVTKADDWPYSGEIVLIDRA
jgi:REP element-mobilizing transposase RayT